MKVPFVGSSVTALGCVDFGYIRHSPTVVRCNLFMPMEESTPSVVQLN